MKQALLLSLVLILTLSLVGCAITPIDTSTPSTSPTDGVASLDNSDGVNYVRSSMSSSDRGLWLKGGTVVLDGLYPGFSTSHDNPVKLEVGNGINDGVVREIYIKVAAEDDADLEGYEQLPSEYYSWFTIDRTFFVLQPGKSQIVRISIAVPKDVDYSGKRARCEILVLGYTVVGTAINTSGETVNTVSNVPIGVASEWYIKTH